MYQLDFDFMSPCKVLNIIVDRIYTRIKIHHYHNELEATSSDTIVRIIVTLVTAEQERTQLQMRHLNPI